MSEAAPMNRCTEVPAAAVRTAGLAQERRLRPRCVNALLQNADESPPPTCSVAPGNGKTSSAPILAPFAELWASLPHPEPLRGL